MEKHVVSITALILGAFGMIVALLMVQSNSRLTSLSEANEQKAPFCPIQSNLYVKEINEDGQEVPLSLDNNLTTDALSWSITDGQNPAAQPLYFNQLPLLYYALDSQALSFSSLPRATDIYHKGDVTFLKLNYPADQFRVVKKEVITCASPHNSNLCSAAGDTNAEVGNALDALDTINNISLDCNMTLEAGWVVQKILSVESQTTETAPVLSECDLNNDGACNTFDLFLVIDDYGKEGPQLTGDLNKDNRVNALDYTLLTSSISHL